MMNNWAIFIARREGTVIASIEVTGKSGIVIYGFINALEKKHDTAYE